MNFTKKTFYDLNFCTIKMNKVMINKGHDSNCSYKYCWKYDFLILFPIEYVSSIVSNSVRLSRHEVVVVVVKSIKGF